MAKLLVIADDFTGALDTGVQFAQKGLSTKVLRCLPRDSASLLQTGAEVLVISAESRHLTAQAAYEAVYALVERAIALEIPYLYKKTDSGLRGNIGKELEAALSASGQQYLTFIPALPEMNRITVDGLHYIDGVPIHESVFGADPFEPVRSARVADLFADVPANVRSYAVAPSYSRGAEKEIGIFDASRTDDIEHILADLSAQGKLGVMAGCAGFASAIARWIRPQGTKPSVAQVDENLLIICGSINGISGGQVAYAAAHGFTRMILTPEQKFSPEYMQGEDARLRLASIKEKCESGVPCIIETGVERHAQMEQHRIDLGIDMETARTIVAAQLGRALKRLLDMGLRATVMIIGGDTLTGFLAQVKWNEIALHREVAPGAVLSSIEIDGKKRWIITKSGGFGKPETLVEISARLKDGLCWPAAKEGTA